MCSASPVLESIEADLSHPLSHGGHRRKALEIALASAGEEIIDRPSSYTDRGVEPAYHHHAARREHAKRFA